MSKWQPIETAPRDGAEILLFCPGLRDWQRKLSGEVIIGAWFSGPWEEDGWYSDSSSDMDGYESTGDYVVHLLVHPTHWMPLPEPPGDAP